MVIPVQNIKVVDYSLKKKKIHEHVSYSLRVTGRSEHLYNTLGEVVAMQACRTDFPFFPNSVDCPRSQLVLFI